MIRLFSLSLIIFLSGITSSVFSQAWTRLSPTPQENTINEIRIIPGTQTLIAACSGSTIMRSEDLGSNWEIIVNPGGQNNDFTVQGVYFIDELVGFAYGDYETMLKTTDGGHTWQTLFKGAIEYYYCIMDMEFFNDSIGMASKYGEGFYYTEDAGETWNVIDTPAYYDFCFLELLDNNEGVALGLKIFECSFMRTVNGGRDWVAETPVGLPLVMTEPSDMEFVNDSTGFVLVHDENGLIFKTTDKGHTWYPCFAGDYYAGDIDFVNEQQGLVVLRESDSLVVLITNDAGITWQVLPLPEGNPRSCSYLNEETAFIAGVNGLLYKSTNAITEWQRLDYHSLPGNVMQSQFLNDSIGFVMCNFPYQYNENKRLMRTTDLGATWVQLNLPNSNFDGGVFYFVSQDTGYVTSYTSFYSTFDGGQSWNSYPSVFLNDVKAIEFLDSDHGIVCTEYDPYYTTDGGMTWHIAMHSDWFDGEIVDIEYISQQEIIVTSGQINSDYTMAYRSINGGQLWDQTLFDFKGYASKVISTGGDTLFVGCTTIFMSTDRGQTWTDMHVNGLEHIQSLSFPSSNVGYAVGHNDFNTLLKTTDGGLTWNPDNLYCTSALNKVHFFSEDRGLVFGDNGVILKTEIGGSVDNKFTPVINETYFKIFPNPVSSILYIDISKLNSGLEYQLSLCDIMGNKVLVYNKIEATENYLNVESLPPGIYFVQIRDSKGGGFLQTLKMIKL